MAQGHAGFFLCVFPAFSWLLFLNGAAPVLPCVALVASR